MTTENETPETEETQITIAETPIRVLNVKLDKEQRKSTIACVELRFNALAEAIKIEGEQALAAIERKKVDLLDSCTDEKGKIDGAFPRHQQPRANMPARLAPKARQAVLGAYRQIRKLRQREQAQEKKFEKLRREHEKQLDKMKLDNRRVMEKIAEERAALLRMVDNQEAAHNEGLNEQTDELKRKLALAIGRVNQEKASAVQAVLLNGDAKVVKAFLDSLPKGSLVELAAREAGLVLPDLADKAEERLMLKAI